jgi:hypothetical protein
VAAVIDAESPSGGRSVAHRQTFRHVFPDAGVWNADLDALQTEAEAAPAGPGVGWRDDVLAAPR